MPQKKKLTAEQMLKRREDAMRYRVAGATWEVVAKKCAYANRGHAYRDVVEFLRKQHNEAADDYRLLELERLDAMTLGVFPKAIKGDTKAVDAVLKIMARRARYIGGLEVPQQHELSSNDGSITVIMSPELGQKPPMAEPELEVNDPDGVKTDPDGVNQ